METVGRKPKIGILGGMGALASAYFYFALIEELQRVGISRDADFPEIILFNLPVEEMDSTGLENGNARKLILQLKLGLKKLEREGSEIIAIPCNTVHFCYEELQAAVRPRLVNIIKETLEEISRMKVSRVGVLSSQTTSRLGLYEKPLSQMGIEVVSLPSKDQLMVTELIESVLSGRISHKEQEELEKIAGRLVAKGAQTVILGCTELPLIKPRTEAVGAPLLDTSRLLAKGVVRQTLNMTNKFSYEAI